MADPAGQLLGAGVDHCNIATSAQQRLDAQGELTQRLFTTESWALSLRWLAHCRCDKKSARTKSFHRKEPNRRGSGFFVNDKKSRDKKSDRKKRPEGKGESNSAVICQTLSRGSFCARACLPIRPNARSALVASRSSVRLKCHFLCLVLVLFCLLVCGCAFSMAMRAGCVALSCPLCRWLAVFRRLHHCLEIAARLLAEACVCLF
jgi:hypothetical protein